MELLHSGMGAGTPTRDNLPADARGRTATGLFTSGTMAFMEEIMLIEPLANLIAPAFMSEVGSCRTHGPTR